MEVQASSSFKLRALLHKLRPHFLEVLGTSDFQDCKAAHEIRKDLELLKYLHQQVILESSNQGAKVAKGKSLGSKPRAKKGKWSYVVGGSVTGWNFVTYLGSKAVYYGVTKEAFRRNKKLRTKGMRS